MNNIDQEFREDPELLKQITEIITPINVPVYHRFLRDTRYPNDKIEHLIQGFTKGFDIGYRGPVNREDSAQNIPLRLGTAQDLWRKSMKEVEHKRYAGPYYKLPYKKYIQSPMGLVPKAGNQTRLIFHLSYNFKNDKEGHQSVNHFTPDEMCAVQYNDLDYAVKTCLAMGESLRATAQQQDE